MTGKALLQDPDALQQTQIMGNCRKEESPWCFQAVHSPKGLPDIFNEHSYPAQVL